jgi:hypothetical protein
MARKIPLSNEDQELLKSKEVDYCVDGYKSFKAVDFAGLHELLQTAATNRSVYHQVPTKTHCFSDVTTPVVILLRPPGDFTVCQRVQLSRSEISCLWDVQ